MKPSACPPLVLALAALAALAAARLRQERTQHRPTALRLVDKTFIPRAGARSTLSSLLDRTMAHLHLSMASTFHLRP